MHKRYLSFALVGMLALNMVLDICATSISDVQYQKNKTQNNLENVNSQIEEISKQQETLKGEVEEMDSHLVDILTSISICKEEIVAKEQEVSQSKEELKVAQTQEQEQYDAMKQRIRFMYEKGDSAYLQVFLESKSISELINKAGYVKRLYSYDRELLETYTNKKEETKQKKQQLEEEEAELLAAHYELEQEQVYLEKLIEEKKSTLDNFDTQLANAKVQAEKYKKQLKQQTQQLRQLEEEERLRAEKAAEEARKAEEAAKQQAAANNSETDTETTTGDTQSGANGSNDSQSSETSGTEENKTGSDKGNAALGQQIADYGKKFVGNPYKFGGTSLTNGTDCSGFTMSVYAHFGIKLPRDSYSQRNAGRGVSYAEAQPGDLICYAGHVGLYIGNGQIVHASTEATGIKFSNATYRTILAVRRIV